MTKPGDGEDPIEEARTLQYGKYHDPVNYQRRVRQIELGDRVLDAEGENS